jgi:hypothetical protein
LLHASFSVAAPARKTSCAFGLRDDANWEVCWKGNPGTRLITDGRAAFTFERAVAERSKCWKCPCASGILQRGRTVRIGGIVKLEA